MKRALLGPALAGLVVAALGAGTYYAPGLLPAKGPQATFYVSPTGSDSDPGSKSAPLRTLERARQAVAALTPTMTGDIHVMLRGGTHQLTEPLRLGPGDSGTNGHRVSWRAAPGERPVLSSGVRITGWSVDDPNRNRWKAPVPAGLRTRQLFVNGVRAERSRIAYGLNMTNQTAPAFPAQIQQTPTGYVTSNTSMRAWRNPQQIEFVWSGQGANSTAAWMEPRCRVQSLTGTATSTTITLRQPCFGSLQPALKKDQTVQLPTYVENVFENTQRPGQWYLDETANVVYYVPRGGEDVNTATVVAPRLEQLVVLDGTPDAPVHDIDLSGLTFGYTTWLGPNSDHGFPEQQANVHNNGTRHAPPPAAVTVLAGRNVRLTDNLFTHLGGSGLEMRGGTQHSEVTGNAFVDISSNGIQLGGFVTRVPEPAAQDRELRVSNNYVTRAGADYRGAVGILAGFVADTTVAHNEVTDLPYSGISVGWGWSLNTSVEGNRIEANNVHNIMRGNPEIFDGGGIYTLGSMATGDRTSIARNWLHDLPYMVGGVYLDAGSNRTDVTANVISESSARTWFFVQPATVPACCDNVIRGNFTSQTQYQTQPNYGANPVSDNQVGLTAWPAEARKVMSEAGLEGRYRHLTRLPGLV